MTTMVEVKTGKNTILNFLMKPVTKTLFESMGELAPARAAAHCRLINVHSIAPPIWEAGVNI